MMTQVNSLKYIRLSFIDFWFAEMVLVGSIFREKDNYLQMNRENERFMSEQGLSQDTCVLCMYH